METKRKLREENIKLKQRVKELESRLCHNGHKWELISSDWKPSCGGMDVDWIYEYQCCNCGKEKCERC